ncbi:hypothetical protein ACBQ54_18385 [Providencia vermicola]|uniref:hypothetical protein n=1 Tax=Providencia vermicola TaxID=333965 RepID=UPI002AB4DAB6|nr:hypothetical protein [Providencia stuartii]
MKKTLLSLSVLGLLSSACAFSTPVTNVKINGNIKPPTCVINGMGNEADIEFKFSPINPAMLTKTTDFYTFPGIRNTLSVVCDATTYLIFTMTDVYPISDYVDKFGSTAYRVRNYGLVDPVTGKEVGGIVFVGQNLTVDGQKVFMGQTAGTNARGVPRGYFVKDRVSTWTTIDKYPVNSINDLDFMPGQTFGMDISTVNGLGYTYLKPTQVLAADGVNVNDGFNFIGQAIMTFKFGI